MPLSFPATEHLRILGEAIRFSAPDCRASQRADFAWAADRDVGPSCRPFRDAISAGFPVLGKLSGIGLKLPQTPIWEVAIKREPQTGSFAAEVIPGYALI